MVHRTDIAGGSTRQASPGNDRMCRPALSRVLLEKPSFTRTSARFSLRGEKCCHLTIAVPPIPAIYLELLTL
jgi:hypothetical protein